MQARIKAAVTLDGNGCWIWKLSTKKPGGYGQIRVSGKTRYAHIVSYEAFVGPVPPGLQLDHFVCDNKRCVNPAHLRPVTQRENSLRSSSVAAENAAKTHCPEKHEYTPENTYRRKGGRDRQCKTCRREKARAARKRLSSGQ